jgi:hypothetical protein
MSDARRTFIDMAARGEVRIEAIDDYIDQWHENPGGQELHEFLGFSEDEYERYLNAADCLPLIVAARKLGRPIDEVVAQVRMQAKGDGFRLR